MTRIDKGIDISGKSSPAGSFWAVFGLTIAGLFVGQFASLMVMITFGITNGLVMEEILDTTKLFSVLSQPQLLISQSIYTIVFTIITPWAYLKMISKKSFSSLSNEKGIPGLPALLAFAATFAFIFVNAWLVEWNANVSLPEFMSGFEEYVKALEEQLAETTELFTKFDTFGNFLLAFLVIAILPGIGEELMFRGVLQNALHRYTQNKHIAIWVTGFIFAAIHFQFYGLVPRTMLGVLFGYIYVWTGNLRLAMIAHIANNGIALCIAYYVQLEGVEFDIDNAESIPGWISLLALVVCGGILFVLRNYYLRSKSPDEQVADSLSDEY